MTGAAEPLELAGESTAAALRALEADADAFARMLLSAELAAHRRGWQGRRSAAVIRVALGSDDGPGWHECPILTAAVQASYPDDVISLPPDAGAGFVLLALAVGMRQDPVAYEPAILELGARQDPRLLGLAFVHEMAVAPWDVDTGEQVRDEATEVRFVHGMCRRGRLWTVCRSRGFPPRVGAMEGPRHPLTGACQWGAVPHAVSRLMGLVVPGLSAWPLTHPGNVPR